MGRSRPHHPLGYRRAILRSRVISAVGIVAIGIVAAVMGGAVFAALIAAIGLGVYYEISRITPRIGLGIHLAWPGYFVVFFGASIALLSRDTWTIAAFLAVAALLPGALIFRSPTDAEHLLSWIGTLAAGLYAGLPVLAAISLRRFVGDVDRSWASDLGGFFTLSGDTTALGMAWCMIAIAATWLSDTIALFVGRSLGRTPLIPRISPKKTLEGAVAGVFGAVVATVVLIVALDVPDVSIPLAIGVGTVLGLIGIFGDLMESFIKRSGGVKDSGTIIPGHGGIFDRVDALFPAFVVTWVITLIIY